MVVRILIAIMVLSTTASANGVVLESYTGERPADAPRLLAPVLEELAKRKYDTGDTVARSYDSQVSRAAQTAKGMPADFAAQIDTGFKAWVSGRFDERSRSWCRSSRPRTPIAARSPRIPRFAIHC